MAAFFTADEISKEYLKYVLILFFTAGEILQQNI